MHQPLIDRRPGALAFAALLFATAAVTGATAVAASAQEPATPDSAAVPDSTVFEVEGIVVHGVRPVVTAEGVSAVEVRMDSLVIGAAPTLDDVLREMPIVQIRENSRGEAHFAMRGAQERQIAVLVDGVPVTLGWDHRQDLSIVPMMAARNITLARGMPSILAGPNVLGGVVEVSVAQGEDPLEAPPPFQASTGIDHVGAHTVSAVAARKFEPGDGELVARLGGGLRESPGQALADGVGDPAADDLRANSDDDRADGFLALRYRSEEGRWLSLAASGFRAERGVPPENHVDEPRLWRYPSVGQFFGALSGGTGQRETPFGGTGDLEASIGFEWGRTEIDEFDTPAYTRITGGETGETRTLSLRLLGDHTLGERGELRAAATLADVRHDETLLPTLDNVFVNEYQQRLWSMASEVSWRFPTLPFGGGTLYGARVTGGFAVDGANTPATGGHDERPPIRAYGGRLGLSTLAGDDSRLHVGLSRRARFPSLRELYSAALGKFEPNPELGPETLLAAEAGATIQLDRGEFQAVGFHHRLRDAIARTASGLTDYQYKRINRDEIRSTGVELVANWAFDGFAVSGDVTLQRVRVSDQGTDEPERQAEYNPSVAGGLDLATTLPLDVRASAGVEYLGRQWCVVPDAGAAGTELDPTARVDASLARTFSLRSSGTFSTLDATVGVDNVADGAIYDQCGLPRPGRTLRVQLRIR